MFDLDGGDVACLVGCDEEYAAAIPEVFAIFFAGFDVELHGLSRHCAILALSVSMNMAEAGSKGMSAGNLMVWTPFTPNFTLGEKFEDRGGRNVRTDNWRRYRETVFPSARD